VYGFFSVTGCKECKGPLEYHPLLPQMEKYFGVYKPGNYWIYYNQDSTKVDSVYVSDYSEGKVKDNNDCVEFDLVSFKLHSEYLSTQAPIKDGILYVTYSSDYKCCVSEVSIISGEVGIFLEAQENVDTLIGGVVIQSFQLWDSPEQTYYEVINYHAFVYFAPNVGIVQYISNIDNRDTFSLATNFIQ